MRVLISGGGIAGMAAANFFHRQGHRPIIIDKAHAFSNVGFVLSLKSFGVEIMEELGLENSLRSQATKSNFVNFRKPSGELVRELGFEIINKNIADSIMAPRATIHDVLYQAVKNQVEIRFNATIRGVTQNESEVTVQLSDSSSIAVDLLVVAEGIHSTTRKLIWKDSSVEDFNIFYAAARLSGKHSYKAGDYQTYRGVKKIFAILPLSETELALQCYFHKTVNAKNIQAISKGLLTDIFNGFPKEVTDLIQKVEAAENIFYDKIGMVRESSLHTGRIVMLGDAGFCPTPLSGMGASLSIFGAKALTHFISTSGDNLSNAFDNYNHLMQPIIQKFQNNARANAKTFLSMSKVSLLLNNLILKYVPSSIISKKVGSELTLTELQKKFSLN